MHKVNRALKTRAQTVRTVLCDCRGRVGLGCLLAYTSCLGVSLPFSPAQGSAFLLLGWWGGAWARRLSCAVFPAGGRSRVFMCANECCVARSVCHVLRGLPCSLPSREGGALGCALWGPVLRVCLCFSPCRRPSVDNEGRGAECF